MPALYFEDLDPGRAFEHEPGRTVTETDNLLFTTLTHNPQPLHFDHEFAARTQHGQVLVNSIFTLGLVVGLSVRDTIRASSRVVDRRRSTSKPDRGIVTFEHRGVNQRGELVCICQRGAMMLCRADGEGQRP